MLITQLKNRDEIKSLLKGKVFLISCLGCKEVYFPLEEVNNLREELKQNDNVVEDIVTDYLCNPEYFEKRLKKHQEKIDSSETVVIFSCGIGVQTVADYFKDKIIYSGCDTMFVPGFQGVTALEYNCAQCGECVLNYTGGICPITTCSKSLLNGQCGGAKNGKCEVDKNMDCGWERIYRRLEKFNRLNDLQKLVRLRDYAKV